MSFESFLYISIAILFLNNQRNIISIMKEKSEQNEQLNIIILTTKVEKNVLKYLFNLVD